MVKSGFEVFLKEFLPELAGKRVGVLCHAPSITRNYSHITDILAGEKGCRLTAVFGPQHGLFGQTQDNMIEWNGEIHPIFNIPVYSLYGEHRKPTVGMLDNIDILLVDLQDVGARLYTYVWTVKLCMEACSEAGIPIWVLDRPNPIAAIDFDGPVLKEEFFTFVGGASIPLCHRMTIGEISVWMREKYLKRCDLKVVKMKGWNRSMMYYDTTLPWVIPSPNMPTLSTAIVYPGSVLIEALNLSEGRGTTLPFELLGAPFIDPHRLIKNLFDRKIPGCAFRIHNFIPTFNKFSGELCNGIQIHVTNIKIFRPVITIIHILEAIIQTSPDGSLRFNNPPYEYEYTLMPFDILSGDSGMRNTLENGGSLAKEIERWDIETESFRRELRNYSLYPESDRY